MRLTISIDTVYDQLTKPSNYSFWKPLLRAQNHQTHQRKSHGEVPVQSMMRGSGEKMVQRGKSNMQQLRVQKDQTQKWNNGLEKNLNRLFLRKIYRNPTVLLQISRLVTQLFFLPGHAQHFKLPVATPFQTGDKTEEILVSY